MITTEMIVHRASEVCQYVDGKMAPVDRLLNDKGLVFGVWHDPEPEGVVTHIIEGIGLLAEIVASGQTDARGVVVALSNIDMREKDPIPPSARELPVMRR